MRFRTLLSYSCKSFDEDLVGLSSCVILFFPGASPLQLFDTTGFLNLLQFYCIIGQSGWITFMG
jgi:hypothetical protein